MNSNIDTVIEDLVNLHAPQEVGARQRHLLRESLRALVRLGQSEQIMGIRSSVRKLSGQSDIIERAGSSALVQGQFEFEPAVVCPRESESDQT
jgi:hypothetical protein